MMSAGVMTASNIPSSVVRTHGRYTGEVLRCRHAADHDAPKDDIDAKHLYDEENP